MPIPLIGAAIGAGGSILGGLLGSRVPGQEKSLMAQEAANAATGGSFAKANLEPAATGLKNAQNFWQQILSGGTSGVSAAVGPELNQLQSQFGTTLNETANTAPRGGGMNEMLSNLPFAERGAASNLEETLFGQAPSGIASTAGELGSLAVGGLGSSTEAAGTGIEAQQNQERMNIANMGQVGQGIGMLLDWLINRKSSQPSSSAGYGGDNTGVVNVWG